MTFCNKEPIIIYQGFGTKWDNNDLLRVSFDSEIDINGFGAEFIIGDIVKSYTDIENGFSVNLTASETATLVAGPICGTLVLIDLENNKRPFSTELPFVVKDWAGGNIKLDGFSITINSSVKNNQLNIDIDTINPLEINEETIRSYISLHNQSEEAHPYIRGLISDEILARENADSDLLDKINANTAKFDNYRTAEAQDVIDNTLETKSHASSTFATKTELENGLNTKQDTLSAGAGITITNNNVVENSGVRDISTGATNGTISMNKNGTRSEVSVAGLGSAAFTPVSDYATAAQGIKADGAVRFNLAQSLTNAQKTQARGNIDAASIPDLETEEETRAYQFGLLDAAITRETREREDTDAYLSDSIDQEVVNRKNADSLLNTDIRQNASNIEAEEEARESADILLYTMIQQNTSDIKSEENARKAADGTLANLTTDAKTNLVSAINEVDSHADINASNISDINALIPNDASSSNQLADKNFVNSSISTNTANFIGTFNSVAELEAYSGPLTNNDYAFVVGTDSAGNTVYDRYKYTDATTPASWVFEYELNNSSFTADQWAAINSLATSSKIAQITTNQNAIGTLSSLTTTAKTDLVSAINELDSDKVEANTAITGATKCKITYDSKGLVTAGSDLLASDIPSLTLAKISDVTATPSEVNVLDGITASTAELNILDGVTATTTELNYIDGVTSNIQTQLNGKVPTSRTINSKALSSNITLDASDVGALPDNTTIGDATLTIQKNGTTIDTFTANATSNKTINLTIPTQASDINAADINLSNLTSTGKNIGNWSSNVTNCITYIPQDIKLELNNGTLTLKAGSKVYVPNGVGVFDSITTTRDINISATGGSGKVLVSINSTETTGSASNINNCVSGAGVTPVDYGLAYDTTTNIITRYGASGSISYSNSSFPLAVCSQTNGTITSIDQVFNGFGYIGSTVFALPGVKCLTPYGRNEDGSLRNTEHTTSSVLTTTNNDTGKQTICLYSSAIETYFAGYKKDFGVVYYDDVENKNYASFSETALSFVGDVVRSSGKITSFTPKTAFHAVDYNDAAKLNADNEFTGNNTFSGDVVFSGNATFNNIVNADISGKAPKDGDGNTISSTYAKLAGNNTFTGTNTFPTFTNHVSGDITTSSVGPYITYQDTNGKTIGQLRSSCLGSGKTKIQLLATYNNVSESGITLDSDSGNNSKLTISTGTIDASSGVKSAINNWGMPNYSAAVSVANNTEYTATENCFITQQVIGGVASSIWINGIEFRNNVNNTSTAVGWFIPKGTTYKTSASGTFTKYPLKGG